MTGHGLESAFVDLQLKARGLGPRRPGEKSVAAMPWAYHLMPLRLSFSFSGGGGGGSRNPYLPGPLP